MQKEEIDEQLQRLKKELARKQKKLQKCIRREKAKAHVRLKIQEHEESVKTAEGSTTKVQKRDVQGTSKVKVHFQEGLSNTTYNTQKNQVCAATVKLLDDPEDRSVRKSHQLQNADFEGEDEDCMQNASSSRARSPNSHKEAINCAKNTDISTKYDALDNVSSFHERSTGPDIEFNCTLYDCGVPDRITLVSDVENTLGELSLNRSCAETLSEGKPRRKVSRKVHIKRKGQQSKLESRSVVSQGNECIFSPVVRDTPDNKHCCSDSEVILGRRLSCGQDRKSRRRIRYSLAKDKATPVRNDADIMKGDVMCISPIKPISEESTKNDNVGPVRNMHFDDAEDELEIAAGLNERGEDQDVAFIQGSEQLLCNSEELYPQSIEGDATEMKEGMYSHRLRSKGKSNRPLLSVVQNPDVGIQRNRSGENHNTNVILINKSSGEKDEDKMHGSSELHLKDTSMKIEHFEEKELVSVAKNKKPGRKRKTSLSELSSLDFSFLDDTGHDLYSQVKTRHRRRSLNSLYSEANPLSSSQSVSSATQLLTSQNSQQNDGAIDDKPLMMPKCIVGLSQEGDVPVQGLCEEIKPIPDTPNNHLEVVEETGTSLLGQTTRDDTKINDNLESVKEVSSRYVSLPVEKPREKHSCSEEVLTQQKENQSYSENEKDSGVTNNSLVAVTKINSGNDYRLKQDKLHKQFSGISTDITKKKKNSQEIDPHKLNEEKQIANDVKFPDLPQIVFVQKEFSLPLKEYGELVQRNLGKASSEDTELSQSLLLPYIQEETRKATKPCVRKRRTSRRRQSIERSRHPDRLSAEEIGDVFLNENFSCENNPMDTQSVDFKLSHTGVTPTEDQILSSSADLTLDEDTVPGSDVCRKVTVSRNRRHKSRVVRRKRNIVASLKTDSEGSVLVSSLSSQNRESLEDLALNTLSKEECSESVETCKGNNDNIETDGNLEIDKNLCRNDIIRELEVNNNKDNVSAGEGSDTENGAADGVNVLDADTNRLANMKSTSIHEQVTSESCGGSELHYPKKQILKVRDSVLSLDMGIVTSGDSSSREILVVAVTSAVQLYSLTEHKQAQLLHSITFSQDTIPQFVKCVARDVGLSVVVISGTTECTVLQVHLFLDTIRWVAISHSITRWAGSLSVGSDLLLEDVACDGFVLAENLSTQNKVLLVKYDVHYTEKSPSHSVELKNCDLNVISKNCDEAGSVLHSLKRVEGLPSAVVGLSSTFLHLWNSCTGHLLMSIQLPWNMAACSSVSCEEGLLWLLVWTPGFNTWQLVAVNPSTLKSTTVEQSDSLDDKSITDSCVDGNCILATTEQGKLLMWNMTSRKLILRESLPDTEIDRLSTDDAHTKPKFVLSKLSGSALVAHSNRIVLYHVLSEI